MRVRYLPPDFGVIRPRFVGAIRESPLPQLILGDIRPHHNRGLPPVRDSDFPTPRGTLLNRDAVVI